MLLITACGKTELLPQALDVGEAASQTSPYYIGMPWHRIVDEAVVRALQARIYELAGQNNQAAAKQLLDKEAQNGWTNLYSMYYTLKDYEENREQYPQIDGFLPVLLTQDFEPE